MLYRQGAWAVGSTHSWGRVTFPKAPIRLVHRRASSICVKTLANDVLHSLREGLPQSRNGPTRSPPTGSAPHRSPRRVRPPRSRARQRAPAVRTPSRAGSTPGHSATPGGPAAPGWVCDLAPMITQTRERGKTPLSLLLQVERAKTSDFWTRIPGCILRRPSPSDGVWLSVSRNRKSVSHWKGTAMVSSSERGAVWTFAHIPLRWLFREHGVDR